eukprot:CAMPEP_0174242432 /NCGR_PEP_ID=MMETSP0417-20130205/27891_1 /TAXON_ID=242541 /ORGANISM="Mayorella sp, Strain BSH-02190019" /LENGTH=98 /DNA_ID=CAMNT_0015321827 /DNA_START=1 /DNA_END=294 /DNA_ORIENTATION=-
MDEFYAEQLEHHLAQESSEQLIDQAGAVTHTLKTSTGQPGDPLAIPIPLYDLHEQFRLVEELHRAGLCLRHMGLLCTHVKSRPMRLLLINEMCIRSLK